MDDDQLLPDLWEDAEDELLPDLWADSAPAPEPEPEPEPDDSWQLTKGIKQGYYQTKGMFSGAAAAASDAVGFDAGRDWGMEGYHENMEEAQKYEGRVPQWEQIESVEDAFDYAMHGIGTVLPQFVPSMAAGGLGGLAARQGAMKAAETIAKKTLQEQLKKGVVAKEAAEIAKKAGVELIRKRQLAGGLAGAAASSTGMETGSIYGDILEKTGESRPGVAFGFGAAAGALDALPVMSILKRMGLAKKATDEIVDTVASAAGKQFLFESTTEGIQTVIERAAVKWVDENQDIFTPEGWSEITNAMAIGGLGGGTIGGGTQLLFGGSDKAPTKDDEPTFDPLTGKGTLPDDTPPMAPPGPAERSAAEARQAAAEAGGDELEQSLAEALAAANEPSPLVDEPIAAEATFDPETGTGTLPDDPYLDDSEDLTPLGDDMPMDSDAELEADEIDAAAHEAATSPLNDLPEPTDAQKEAGNYKKGHHKFGNLDLTIENPQGSTRAGKDPDGKEWSHDMQSHYGYVKRTEGADGDQVDVFVGPNPASERVFVVDQVGADGSFDEHKAMLGYDSETQAVDAYRENYDEGWTVGPVTELSREEFEDWVLNGDTKAPLAGDIATESVIPPDVQERLNDLPVMVDNVTQGFVDTLRGNFGDTIADAAQEFVDARQAAAIKERLERDKADSKAPEQEAEQADTLDDRIDRLIDTEENKSGNAYEAATRPFFDMNRSIEGLKEALEAGRTDIADIIIERAERSAQKAKEQTPGVPEGHSKYEKIIKELSDRAEETRQQADQLKNLRRLVESETPFSQTPGAQQPDTAPDTREVTPGRKEAGEKGTAAFFVPEPDNYRDRLQWGSNRSQLLKGMATVQGVKDAAQERGLEPYEGDPDWFAQRRDQQWAKNAPHKTLAAWDEGGHVSALIEGTDTDTLFLERVAKSDMAESAESQDTATDENEWIDARIAEREPAPEAGGYDPVDTAVLSLALRGDGAAEAIQQVIDEGGSTKAILDAFGFEDYVAKQSGGLFPGGEWEMKARNLVVTPRTGESSTLAPLHIANRLKALAENGFEAGSAPTDLVWNKQDDGSYESEGLRFRITRGERNAGTRTKPQMVKHWLLEDNQDESYNGSFTTLTRAKSGAAERAFSLQNPEAELTQESPAEQPAPEAAQESTADSVPAAATTDKMTFSDAEKNLLADNLYGDKATLEIQGKQFIPYGKAYDMSEDSDGDLTAEGKALVDTWDHQEFIMLRRPYGYEFGQYVTNAKAQFGSISVPYPEYADGGKPLADINVQLDYVGEDGGPVRVFEQADKAMAEIDQRLDGVKILLGCVKK